MAFARFNIVSRLIILSLVMGLVPVLAVSAIVMSVSLNSMEDSAVSSLQANSELQNTQIESNLKRVVKDAIFLAEQHSLKRFLEGLTGELVNVENEFLEFNKARPQYYQVRFLNFAGREVIRSNFRNNSFFLTAKSELQFKGHRYYFKNGLAQSKGNVYFSPIDLNIEHGHVEIPKQMVIRICAPVYIGEEKMGLVVINMFAKEFFQWIKLPSTPFSSLLLNEKGEIIQVEKNKNMYDFPRPIREKTKISNVFPFLSMKKLNSMKTGIIKTASYVTAIHVIQGTGNFNHPSWTLITFFPRSYFQPQINVFKLNFFLAVIVVIALGVILGIFTARKITRPLWLIRREIGFIAEGRMDNETKIKTGDETEELADKLNRMKLQVKKRIDRLANANREYKEKLQWSGEEIRSLERQLHRADKLASLGELSMRLAHEIGNPLASLKTVAQTISEDIEENPAQDQSVKLGRIVSEVDRLNGFLRKFNNFAIMKEKKPVLCDLRELVRDVNFFLRIEADEHGVEIKENFDQQDTSKTMVDPQQIKQVLVNLILNAIQACDRDDSVQVSIRNANGACCCELRESCFCNEPSIRPSSLDYEEIGVCDTGKGIPKEHLIKVFDPFFSTKTSGTGLGLSIVHRIVEQHNGVIRVHSQEGKGTTFRILLPALNEAPTS